MPSVAQLALPMFLGTVLNWALFGILLVQVYIYFSIFRKDRSWLKLLVVLIVFLEFVETFSSLRDMVHVFGTQWGNPDALDNVGWAWFSVPVMGAIIAFFCQSFYGWRIYIIGMRSNPFFAPFFFASVVLVSLLQLAGGIWAGVEICIAKKFSLLQSDNLPATATWLVATAVADLLIVFGTIYVLRQSTDPEFLSAKTNSLVSRIILLTAETGFLCTVFVLVDLFLFVFNKDTNDHLSVCIELSKIYSNSILLMFNSRAHMGYECNHMDIHSVNLSGTALRTRIPSVPAIQIGVQVSSDQRSDITHNSFGKKLDV
ncbi:hypothetical protein K438DRAFT_1970618 [Mycena galopus ATCC 62051]|nr:hypothetical protein K438DRAFT_1970618 [Mycena galopus ATCC 62051]